MKVEKIDITKELMDIPDRQSWIDFAFWNPIDPQFVSDGSIPSGTMTGRTRRYEVEKVKRYGETDYVNYLVSVDDRRIFQDLIAISDSTFRRAVDDKTNFYMDWMKREMDQQRWKIKGLPWWKRLFKKF